MKWARTSPIHEGVRHVRCQILHVLIRLLDINAAKLQINCLRMGFTFSEHFLNE
jgi:hypothetical protein